MEKKNKFTQGLEFLCAVVEPDRGFRETLSRGGWSEGPRIIDLPDYIKQLYIQD